MRYPAPALLALALVLHSHAHAELISGQVSGTTPAAIPWNGIEAGKPFVLEFTLDTEARSGPAWSGFALDNTNLVVNLFVDGVNHQGDAPYLHAVAGPGDAGRGGLGVLAEDSLAGSWLAGAPDNLFVVAFTIPGLIDDPAAEYPLSRLTLAGITGVTFGFADADEQFPVPILLAIDAPVSPVPEPSTYLLGMMALVGLWGSRRWSKSKTAGPSPLAGLR